MLMIYYQPDAGDEEALNIRDDLRRNGIPAAVRNGAAFREPFQYERCDAILSLDCPDVAEAYAVRNELMNRATERGDIKQFAGLTPVEIFMSAAQLYAALEGTEVESAPAQPEPAAVDSNLTKQELIDLGAARGVTLDMSMTKAQMLEQLE